MLAAIVALVLAVVWWRSRSEPGLNVTPDAQKAIEKAKSR